MKQNMSQNKWKYNLTMKKVQAKENNRKQVLFYDTEYLKVIK